MASNKSKKKRRSTADRAREKAKGRKNKGGNNYLKDVDNWFQPKKGTNMIDLVPYEVTAKNNPDCDAGDLDGQRTIFVHFNVGAEDLKFICPKTIGKKCPMCEQNQALYKEGDIDAAKEFRAKERQLFNVWNHEEDRPEIWDISYYLFGGILDEEIEEDDDVAGYADLEEGLTLKVRMKEASIGDTGSKFLDTSKIDFKDRSNFGDDILDLVYNLDDILIIPTYEQLEKAFLEIEEDEEDEDGNTRKKNKRSRKSSRRSRGDDDDDDADNDDDDDDVDDDIDDDEDIDDDDDVDDDDIDDDDDDSDDEEEDDDDDDESADDEDDEDSESDDEDDSPPRRSRRGSKSDTKTASSKRGGGRGKSSGKKPVSKSKTKAKSSTKPARRRRRG